MSVIEEIEKMLKLIKNKIIHPRIAAETFYFAYLLIILIIEKITNILIFNNGNLLIILIFAPISVIIYYNYDKTYNKKIMIIFNLV